MKNPLENPEPPNFIILGPAFPHFRYSSGRSGAMLLLESMTDATWQAHRDAALARLHRARARGDRNILRSFERP